MKKFFGYVLHAFDDNRWFCFDCRRNQPHQTKRCVYCGSPEVDNVA